MDKKELRFDTGEGTFVLVTESSISSNLLFPEYSQIGFLFEKFIDSVEYFHFHSQIYDNITIVTRTDEDIGLVITSNSKYSTDMLNVLNSLGTHLNNNFSIKELPLLQLSCILTSQMMCIENLFKLKGN